MSNLWKKKMIEQVCLQLLRWSYPIYSKVFETRIKNLEKSVPSRIVPSRNKKKNNSKNRQAVTFGGPKDEDSNDKEKRKKFCKYHSTCENTTNECTTVKA